MKNKGFLILTIIATILAVGFTFNYAVQFSAFAAGLAKSVLAIALFVAFDKFVMKKVDTVGELKKGNVAYALFLVAIALLFSINTATAQVRYNEAPEHIKVAVNEAGVTEAAQNNTGREIEAYLQSVDLGPGYPWCAAYVSWVLDSANVDDPPTRSAAATEFISESSIPARKVLRGTVKAPAWGLAIHRRGNTWAGHIGFVLHWDKAEGITISGNTSAGGSGSQRDGQGVYIRRRAIEPGNYFRIVQFTPVIS